ncbi:MAG TPA: signal peptidase I [Ruminococcaceae bacterium]|nr:signal peptidase I [Oscillospiraceae bacterium]
MTRVFNIIYNFFAIVIVLFFLFTSVIAVSGTKVYAVATGSMEPEISKGSVVFVRPQSAYQVGDVITAFLTDEQTFTHRIVEMDAEQVYTKGDANLTVDPIPTQQNRIVGKVLFHLPLLGFLALHFNVTGILIAFGAVLVILIVVRFVLAKKQKHMGGNADEKNQ